MYNVSNDGVCWLLLFLKSIVTSVVAKINMSCIPVVLELLPLLPKHNSLESEVISHRVLFYVRGYIWRVVHAF